MAPTEPSRGTPLHIDDAGFVRVPESRCYRVLTDLAGWTRWWRGTTVVDRGDDRVTVTIGWPGRRLRLDLEAGGWRHDAGFTATLAGDVTGTWEVWLEPLPAGTVVHHVVAGSSRRPRHGTALRRWLRRGLWDLKDVLEDGARRAMLEHGPADGGGGPSSTRGTGRE